MQCCSNDQIERVLELLKLTQKKMREAAIIISKEYGLTLVQLSAIFILRDTPNLMLNELSIKMGLSKSTVSSIVERLEEQGIVVREIPKENRRIVRLSLSTDFLDKNLGLLEEKKWFIDNILNFKNVSKEEVDKIIYGMEKLNDLFVTNHND